MPRISILMIGQPYPAIRERFNDFDSWFQERSGTDPDFSRHQLVNDQLLPNPSISDGWILLLAHMYVQLRSEVGNSVSISSGILPDNSYQVLTNLLLV